MRFFLKTIFVLITITLIAIMLFVYSEVKIHHIKQVDNNIIKGMQKRGFFSECIPKDMYDLKYVWDIDTNHFYMKYKFNGSISFYNQEKCNKLKEINIKKLPRESLLKGIFFPNFINEINMKIKEKRVEIYVSYINKKTNNGIPFYIFINNNTHVGYAVLGVEVSKIEK